MQKPPFEDKTDLAEFLSKSTFVEFQSALPHFSSANLCEAFSLLQALAKTSKRDKKLSELFLFLDSPSTLKSVAAFFHCQSFIGFLKFLKEHADYQNRLSFVLMGIPQTVFSSAILDLDAQLVALMKHESSLEPLQHHLSLFIEHGLETLQHFFKKSEALKLSFQRESASTVTYEYWNQALRAITALKLEATEYRRKIDQVLGIVWHTLRTDLIEKLGSLDKKIQYFCLLEVGEMFAASGEEKEERSTGLYKALQDAHASIYQHSFTDQSLAIDALSALSIWQIQDYIACGLLPFFQTVAQYEEQSQKVSEKEKKEYKNDLLLFAQKELAKAGLVTVADLKQAGIFSKEMLIRCLRSSRSFS